MCQSDIGVLLAYTTIAHFQWGLLNNDPHTYTVKEENGRVFLNLTKLTDVHNFLSLKAILKHHRLSMQTPRIPS